MSAFSATINITYQVQDFGLTTNGLRRVTLTPIAKGGDYTNSFLVPSPMTPDTFANGAAVFSNKVPGYAYSVAFETTFSTTRRTNYFPTGLSGNVNGLDYTGWIQGFARDGSVLEFAFLNPTNLTSTVSVVASNIAFQVSSTNQGSAVTASGASVAVTNASLFTVITTNASGLTGGTLSPDRVVATFSNLPIYYVDGLNGSDANHGRTPQAAWRTVLKVHTNFGAAVQSTEIRFWGPFEYTNQLTLGTNSIVRGYGAGRPVFNASDIVTNWAIVSGLTNVYAVSNFVVTGGGGPSTIPVMEDGTIMIGASSLSVCIQTDGSFFSGDSPAAGSTNTVFINPIGLTDPTTNGRLYEIARRDYGILAGDNCIIEGVITKNQMHNNGSLEVGKNALIKNVHVENGTKHSILIASGKLEDVTTWKNEIYTGDEIPIVGYSQTDGLSLEFIRVKVRGIGPSRLVSDGFYAHTAGIADNPGYASVVMVDCEVSYAGGFGGFVLNTNRFLGLFGCRAYATSTRGFVLGIGTNRVENCEIIVSPDVPFSPSGIGINIQGRGRYELSNVKIVGPPFAVRVTSGPNVFLDIRDSIIGMGNTTGVSGTAVTNTTILFSNNIVGAGTPFKFDQGVNTVFIGNSNVYGYATTPIGFYLDSQAITNWPQWQAAVSPYDANSLTNEIQWTGWPTNGNFHYSTTSPAVTNAAGPGWRPPVRPYASEKLSQVPTRTHAFLSTAPWLDTALNLASNSLYTTIITRNTNIVDIAGGSRISTNLITTNIFAAAATTSGRMTNAGMTINTTFNQLRLNDSGTAGTSSDHIIELYDNSNARQAFLYKEAGGKFIIGNDITAKPIIFNLNAAEKFTFQMAAVLNTPQLAWGGSNANTPAIRVDLGAGLELTSAQGIRTGTNHFGVSGNIFAQGAVFATNGFTGDISGTFGNGAGLSNTVDLIAGNNITIVTNANNRSFTIEGSGGAGVGLPGTNTTIVYGNAQRTNASGTFTGIDLVASNALGSVTMIGGDITASGAGRFNGQGITLRGAGGDPTFVFEGGSPADTNMITSDSSGLAFQIGGVLGDVDLLVTEDGIEVETIFGNVTVTGEVTADSFVGDGTLLENVTAANIGVTDSTDATSFVSIFDNATGNLEAHTDPTLTFNALTGQLNATTFSGAHSGNGSGLTSVNAATATVADTTDTTAFVGLWDSATGNQAAKTDGGITYNAGTGQLTVSGVVSTFAGDGSGVTNVTATSVTVAESTDASSFVAIWDSATGTQTPRSHSNLTYNASTSTLGVGGNLTVGGSSTFGTLNANDFNATNFYLVGITNAGSLATDGNAKVIAGGQWWTNAAAASSISNNFHVKAQTFTGATGIFSGNIAGNGAGLTNVNVDAATGTVKFKQYIYLNHPHLADGTGATISSTNTSINYGHATFSNSADQAGNYVEYRLQVPTDIDTSVAMRAKLKYRLTAADTGTHRYVVSMVDQADSASATGTVGDAVNMDFAGDGSGAIGDVETIGWTTLTGWAAALAADNLWVIRLARDGNDAADASTVDTQELGLVIEYGVTQ